jgi:hypothetical protein
MFFASTQGRSIIPPHYMMLLLHPVQHFFKYVELFVVFSFSTGSTLTKNTVISLPFHSLDIHAAFFGLHHFLSESTGTYLIHTYFSSSSILVDPIPKRIPASTARPVRCQKGLWENNITQPHDSCHLVQCGYCHGSYGS